MCLPVGTTLLISLPLTTAMSRARQRQLSTSTLFKKRLQPTVNTVLNQGLKSPTNEEKHTIKPSQKVRGCDFCLLLCFNCEGRTNDVLFTEF